MTIDYYDAYVAMSSRFKSVWLGAQTILGYAPDALYMDRVYSDPMSPTKTYAEFAIRPVDGQNSAISPVGTQKRFTDIGFLHVELYVPFTEGAETLVKLTNYCLNSYRAKSDTGGIRYTEAYPRDVPHDGKFLRRDVIVNYEYHSIATVG